MGNGQDRVWRGSTVDAKLEIIPGEALTKEQYEASGGVPFSGRTSRRLDAAAQETRDNIDASVGAMSARIMSRVREQAGFFDAAMDRLRETEKREAAYDKLHGQGAWQKVIDRCTAVYNDDAKESEADLQDPDYLKVMRDCEDTWSIPIDFCVQGEQMWVDGRQADLNAVIAEDGQLMASYPDSFIRNAIRSAQAEGIEIDHPEADNL